MHRFFCSPQNITDQKIQILNKDELHHIRDVLRLKYKDKVLIIDGNGREFICQISHLNKNSATLEIIKKHLYKKEELPLRLTIACALPKKSKMDFIVEKLTEIGVEKIIFLKTERTQVNFKNCANKITRLRKIAESTLKQSGNLFTPEIEFLNFDELLKLKSNDNFDTSTPLSINPERSRRIDLAVIANLAGHTRNLKDVLEKNNSKKILVAIGPEGDFTEEEITLAKQAGFISVSLGNTVLRVETAVIVTAGFIKLYLR